MFQNTVIGYFDMSSSPQPPGFEQFYYAAMRIIETGNIRDIASNKPHDDDGVKFAFSRRRTYLLPPHYWFVPEPRNQVKVGLVTERKLATKFEIHRSPNVLLVRSLNGTVVSGSRIVSRNLSVVDSISIRFKIVYFQHNTYYIQQCFLHTTCWKGSEQKS